ncbi:hypothetical protein CTAYLR_000060 [Chrysophaeum taylorii]|uniref:Uncharacterized protein n=1 Tax=Chrysophaeum taylorii TaxID=2483200 RepID=A0AAD7XNF7_9STRA|nr:hypothetical protein CTAYLR_000060 [Chrysophaeum taylorii]
MTNTRPISQATVVAYHRPDAPLAHTTAVVATAQPAGGAGAPVAVAHPATCQPVQSYPADRATHVQAFVAVPPPQGMQVEERYCGAVSCCIATVLFILFWPAALFVPCCPCDRRRRVVFS